MELRPKLTQLNRKEILLYLGYHGQQLTQPVLAQLEECERELCEKARPKVVCRVLPLEAECRPAGTELALQGADIRELLHGCGQIILMAATLGPDVDALISRAQVRDMTRAVILDACGSTAIENVCNHLEEDLRAFYEAKGLFLTDRFSPGYGDLPLEQQRELCRALDTVRKIGLAVSPTLMLTPSKSVTAVMGIADAPQPHRPAGCEQCSMFYSCQFRREGKVCHE